MPNMSYPCKNNCGNYVAKCGKLCDDCKQEARQLDKKIEQQRHIDETYRRLTTKPHNWRDALK